MPAFMQGSGGEKQRRYTAFIQKACQRRHQEEGIPDLQPSAHTLT